MGCDIHAMVEAKFHYRHATDCWSWQSCGRVHIGRNYELFAKLADVRNYDGVEPIAPPRLNNLIDNDEHDDERASEDFWLLARSWGSGGHSHSWVTLDELQTADPDLAARCRLIVLAHGLDVKSARLTFFFDN